MLAEERQPRRGAVVVREGAVTKKTSSLLSPLLDKFVITYFVCPLPPPPSTDRSPCPPPSNDATLLNQASQSYASFHWTLCSPPIRIISISVLSLQLKKKCGTSLIPDECSRKKR